MVASPHIPHNLQGDEASGKTGTTALSTARTLVFTLSEQVADDSTRQDFVIDEQNVHIRWTELLGGARRGDRLLSYAHGVLQDRWLSLREPGRSNQSRFPVVQVELSCRDAGTSQLRW